MRLIFALAALLAVASCTKTEDYERLAQNRILEYKVTNLQDTVIYGAIDNIDNTITVYLPFYLPLDVIDPAIKLDDKATLEGELEPVDILDATHTYTVKGADKTTRTYKLIIKIQTSYGLKVTSSWAVDAEQYPNKRLNVTANFLTQHIKTLSLAYTNKATNKVSNVVNEAAEIKVENGQYLLYYTTPIDLTTGDYTVKMSFLGHTVDLPAVKVKQRAPSAALGYRSVVQGGTLVITPNDGYVFYGMQTAKVTINGTDYTLGVENPTATAVTLRFPDNIPLGQYWGAPLKCTYKDWAGEITDPFGYITITQK
jgi:hypothetical protein